MEVTDFKNVQLSNISFKNPEKFKGSYICYAKYDNDQTLNIQTPRMKNLDGVHKTETRAHLDLYFQKEHIEFYNFLGDFDDTMLATIQKNGEEWFLFGERYQTSSQLAAYLPKKEYVYNLSGGKSQFDYWKDRDEVIGKNGIFIAHSFYNRKPEDKFLFDKVELVDTVLFKRWGRIQREYYIYKIYNFKGRK